MHRSTARRIRSVVRSLPVLALLAAMPALTGCASSGSQPRPVPIDSKRALIDSYLIAHGMALGYGRSGRAGPAEIAQLIQYDRAAMIAVAAATFEPGSGHTSQAQAAVGAMLRYTSTQDLSGMSSPDAP